MPPTKRPGSGTGWVAKPVEIDGVRYGSKAEAESAAVMAKLDGWRALYNGSGKGRRSFTLFGPHGEEIGRYTADWLLYDLSKVPGLESALAMLPDEQLRDIYPDVAVDVKGWSARSDWELRAKLFRACYPHIRLDVVPSADVAHYDPRTWAEVGPLREQLRKDRRRAKRARVKGGGA